MFRYIKEPLTFRLSTWPWGGSSHINVFRHTSRRFDIQPLLAYLEQELLKTPTRKVRYTTFTLVNVYSTFTRLSYGYTKEPLERIRRGPICFTFAMTRRNEEQPFPKHVIWNTGYTCLWGPTLQTGHDYLTISVPINISMQCGLSNTLRRRMEELYKLIGAWSKSFVLDRASVQPRTSSIRQVRSLLYYKTIPKAMWYYPWQDWVFVREFWEKAPDFLRINATPLFAEYFIANLTRYYTKYSTLENIKAAELYVEDFVRRGVLDIAQKLETAEAEIILRYLSSSDKAHLLSGDSVDVESIIRSVCGGYR